MPSDLTRAEEGSLNEIAEKVRALRDFLTTHELPADSSRVDEWFRFLGITKAILGNFNNDVSFVTTLLAKFYLAQKHAGLIFDAAEKRQSAPGLDIDVRLVDGKRIIGEVKTVEPYQLTDFGAQQRAAFLKDFAKLANAAADYKYLFLGTARAFEVVRERYREELKGVQVVCLTDNKEFLA